MPDLRITLPRPHQGQRQILPGLRRFNVLACGRRFGKTTFGINRLAGPALEGWPVAWFAPTYKYLDEAWRDFLRVLRPTVKASNATARRIELVTGGVIEFWSLTDPDSGRSRRYKRVAVDEAAKVPRLEQAWSEAILPTLADFRGDADLYSTPRGRDYFWRLFERGRSQDWPDWAAFQLPTAANPIIHPDEIESARTALPERVFRQEWLAEFLEDAGGVFRLVAAAVDRGRCSPDPPRAGIRSYSTGIDLARLEDFTVLTTLDPSGRMVYFERFNQISWERQIAAIEAVLQRYPGSATLDATGIGDPIFEALRKRKLSITPFTFTAASKLEIIDGLALALERGHIRLMDVPELEHELCAFEYTMRPGSRTPQMSAPDGEHDDCVIALALAHHGRGIGQMPIFMDLTGRRRPSGDRP